MVHCLLPVLSMINPIKSTIRKRNCLKAHGIMVNFLGTTCNVLILNLSETEGNIPYHMHVSISNAYTCKIVHFLQWQRPWNREPSSSPTRSTPYPRNPRYPQRHEPTPHRYTGPKRCAWMIHMQKSVCLSCTFCPRTEFSRT